jgi:anion-transporting  ArsA/GET3 family ATPase
MSLDRVLAEHRIVVCVGSGGVGKTTVAAALALKGAREGRRAMVLTIDPARRLAQSLGLEDLRPGGERIPAERLAEAGLPGDAVLAAGMLEQSGAWDRFIGRHAPSPEVVEAILSNPFYRNLSRTFAGSTEYMAIEELGRLDEEGLYDLIVLDTPPSRYALDFLEAPRRLEEFFDRSVMGWLARPASAGWAAWKTASRGARFLFERIEDATGLQALSEIASFFAAVEGLVDGVTARSRKVRALLTAPDTAFVLVTGPDEQVLEDAEGLVASMAGLGVTLKAVVMNRLLTTGGFDDPAALARGGTLRPSSDGECGPLSVLREDLEAGGIEPATARWMCEALEARLVQAAAQAVRREVFEAGLPASVSLAALPEQPRDVHSLTALAALAELLGD